MTTAGAVRVPDGLEHLGHVYEAPEDLVAAVLPRVRTTLAGGGRVSAIVGRRTRRVLLEALGSDAGIDFTTTGALRPAPPEGFLEHVREAARPPGGLVLAQYSAFDVPDAELRVGEERVNRLPAALPVALVCACARDDRPARVDTVRTTHPHLLTAEGACANPDHPGAAPLLPRAGDVHVLHVAAAGTAALAGLRAQIDRAAREAGLTGDRVHRAVAAVHEAAIVVGLPGWAGSVACELDVWAGAGSLAVALRGPNPTTPDVGNGVWDTGIPPQPGRSPGPLENVRLFCRAASLDETPDGRVIRLLLD